MKIKGLIVFFSLIALSFSANNHAYANGPKDFTNSDLMSFSIDQRHAYYTGSMISISHVISLYDKEKGQCFSDWFFEATNKRIMEIEEEVNGNPSLTPSTIMITLPQLKCGKLIK